VDLGSVIDLVLEVRSRFLILKFVWIFLGSVIDLVLEVRSRFPILKFVWIFISLTLYNNYFSISKESHTCPDRVLFLSSE
jgi:hypothetical protein